MWQRRECKDDSLVESLQIYGCSCYWRMKHTYERIIACAMVHFQETGNEVPLKSV